jgi:hypothetical protein
MSILSSCATVEVAKEVTKASQSIKTSVNNIINSNQKTNGMSDKQEASASKPYDLADEVEIVKKEKKDEREKIKEQKKIVKVVFLGKTHEEIKVLLGVPQLRRMDGGIQVLRFDQNSCRLFLFFNAKAHSITVEYFELRDDYGTLIDVKDKIQSCYKDLNLN